MFLFINSKSLLHTLTDNLIEQPYWTALLYSLIVQPYCTTLLSNLIIQPHWTALLYSLNLILLNLVSNTPCYKPRHVTIQKVNFWGGVSSDMPKGDSLHILTVKKVQKNLQAPKNMSIYYLKYSPTDGIAKISILNHFAFRGSIYLQLVLQIPYFIILQFPQKLSFF